MDQKRVSEIEGSDLNPAKFFIPDFRICDDDFVHTQNSSLPKDIGPEGADLFGMVRAIPGVYSVTISKHELRVSKHLSHSWEEITPKIEGAFRVVFGSDIRFIGENSLILMYRRLRAKLK